MFRETSIHENTSFRGLDHKKLLVGRKKIMQKLQNGRIELKKLQKKIKLKSCSAIIGRDENQNHLTS